MCINTDALKNQTPEKYFPPLSAILRDLAQEPKPSDLLPPRAAAIELQVTAGTLAVWRCTGRYSLPFVKIGSKVFYRRSDISSFIESRIQTQTA